MVKPAASSSNTTGMSDVDYLDSSLYPKSETHLDFYKVIPQDTDGPTGISDYRFQGKFTAWHGYYRQHAVFSAVIDTLSDWAVGSGFESTQMEQLLKIRGTGKQGIREILENLLKVALFSGDSFAERIRDKAKRLINLKIMNPGSVVTIYDEFGMLKKYEQISRNKTTKKVDVMNEFDPEEIFHLSWNPVADEVHGVPYAEKVEYLLKAMMEAFLQTKVLMKRHVQPVIFFHTGTDDTGEVTQLKTKIDRAYKNTENVFIPTGTIEKIEQVSTPQFSTIDPLPWLRFLQRQFITACKVPEVIIGWGEETTEASSKVIYLAFEQTIRKIQVWYSEQLRVQLGIEITFIPPPSLEQFLGQDQRKDGSMEAAKPSDMAN